MGSRQFFVGNVENAILTRLTHPADAILSAADFIAEIVSRFAAADTSATRHCKTAGPPEDVEGDAVEVVVHLFTFHGDKVSKKFALVNRFFQKILSKKMKIELDSPNFVKNRRNTLTAARFSGRLSAWGGPFPPALISIGYL